MPLFFTLLVFLSYIQYIHTFLHPLTFAEVPLHSVIAEQLSGRHLPGVPSEPGIELGPALQRAGVLPTEPRRSQLSHAADRKSAIEIYKPIL